MADKTVTVKSSGGDYTTLNAALSGESGALPGILTIEHYASASPDTTAANTGTGYSGNDATHYIHIIAPTSERHDGKYNTSKSRLTGTTGTILTIGEQYTRLTGLQVIGLTGYIDYGIYSSWDQNKDMLIDSCIVAGISGVCYRGIFTGDFPAGVIIRNTLCYGWAENTGITVGGSDNSSSYATLQNVTVVGCAWGIKSATYARLYNVVSYDNSTDDFNGTFGTSYNNASEDNTAPGTNSKINQSFTNTFVDAGNKDFHLLSTDTVLKDSGYDLSGTFTADIDGATRSGTWDIGADEYVAAGGTTLTISVTDSVTGAEVITGLTSTLICSVSDSTGVLEVTTGQTGSLVCSTSDSLGISEVTTSLTGGLILSTSDTFSVNEVVSGLTGYLVCSVTESVTVTEVTTGTASVSISVTESVTVSGVVTIQLSLGSICWGQSTDVTELVKRTFSNWTGTGSSGGSGDEEVLEIHSGEYMQSAAYELGLGSYAITVNKYRAGGTPTIRYKTATTSAGIAGASLLTFSGSFSSLGWIQVRLEATGDTIVEDVEVNLITLAPSASDSVTVDSTTSAFLAELFISVTETIESATEVTCVVNAAAEGPTLLIDISDSIEVLEVVSSIIPWYNVSVSDSTSVSEVSILSMIREVSIFDTFLVGEEVEISCPLAGAEASETVLVQELVGCSLGPLELNVEETSSLAESTISVVSAPVINTSESLLVLEEITVVRIVSGEFNIQDSVSVEDSIGIKVSDLPSSSFEIVTLDEQASVEIRLQVEAVEDITVSEEVQTSTSAFEISVNDSLLVEEVVIGVAGGLVINITDSIEVEEVVSIGSTFADLDATTSSDVTVNDSVNVEFVFAIGVTEQVVITESVSCWTGDLSLAISDGVVLSESVNIYWSIASGLLILDCDILVPLIDCELLYPEINVYMQLPTIDLEVA